MADVRPFRALRFSPDLDLSAVICPPFDTISPDEQARLYELSPHNAVRLELPKGNGDRYEAAAASLNAWLSGGALRQDESPAFYVYEQTFRHSGRSYVRRALFARLRLEPWEKGIVLPHEQTFRAPKQDRMNLLHSIRVNTSPIFLIYPDARRQVAPILARAVEREPDIRFDDPSGISHSLWRVDDPETLAAIAGGFESERLYIADGHHRYETALAFRDEALGSAAEGPGDEPERFTMVALVAADDPGLLVLPIHRIVKAELPLEDVLDRLMPLFDVEPRPSLEALVNDMRDRGRMVNAFGLLAAESPEFYLLTKLDPAADPYLPAERPPIWRRLDAAVASHIILRHGLGVSDSQMEDIRTVWYEEDAERAVAQVRDGAAGYTVLLNPVSPRQIVAVADAGERMPQKSTFFYPKLPTGLLFYPLFGQE